MKTLNISEDALVRHVFVVPSGAAEIIRRQRSGWTYLRP
jgi:intracellular sulfur oxidation DsrE/DsrF family protein